MPFQTNYQDQTPVELLEHPSLPKEEGQSPTFRNSTEDEKIRSYVIAWRDKLRTYRLEKMNIWNECWALYRGEEDFTNKEDWQSKIVLPKAWGTVKQATNVIKRLMNTSKHPYQIEPTNPNDTAWELRGEKMTDLMKVFLDKAHFMEEFGTGLEAGFIMGLGLWKIGWNLSPRVQMRVQTAMIPMQGNPTQVSPYGPQDVGPVQTPNLDASVPPPSSPYLGGPQQTAAPSPIPEQTLPGRQAPLAIGQGRMDLVNQQNQLYPTQLGGENLLPPGALGGTPTGGLQQPLMVPTKQIVRQEIMEGKLSITAVDPYNFYWLPGSKLNRWTGTIEEIEVPKWQLLEMAQMGAFDIKLIQSIGPMSIPENQRQSWLRFSEMPRTAAGPTEDTGIVKLTEFYGPIVLDGEVTEKYGHVIIANDNWVLFSGVNDKWHRKCPYIGFSPLQLPFRTDGIGLIEMVRQIDKALNQITNLGVDTLLFRLMPLFEYTPDIYENPEDFRNGITPGKMFRRNQLAANGDMGLRPIEMQDISPGATQMAGLLDRAHQEGGLVSELQQSLPRWSGAQTATETDAIQQNQQSFFGSMAADIEQFCMSPMIEMSLDTIMQYIDTANDARIAAILGVDQPVLAGMSQAEVMEMVQGDYDIKVTGLSSSLEKAEMLQNMVQLMNLIGQNPEAWLPYINQDALLRRILESFRPAIHDIEQIIADPQTVAANKEAAMQQQQMAKFTEMIPQLAQMAHETQKQEHQVKKDVNDAHSKAVDQALQYEAIKAKPVASGKK